MKLLYVLLVFIFSLSLPVYAATSHTIKKGDTLHTIAKKYSMSVGELKKLNHLKNEKLRPGRQLLVKNTSPKTYTVKRGDTIIKIAKKLKMDTAELKEINDLKSSVLKPGQKLFLAKRQEEIKVTEELNPAPVSYDRKLNPVITSARLEEVKSMSTAEDILTELSMKERLVLFAKKMLHLPYKFGGNGTFGLDCSAFVQKVYGFVGRGLPRSAREQFHIGEKVNKDELLSGDLVFFRTYASFPSHVGIYLGNNLFIHASSLSKKITIDSLESPYYVKRYIGAKRLLPEEERALRLELEKEEASALEN